MLGRIGRYELSSRSVSPSEGSRSGMAASAASNLGRLERPALTSRRSSGLSARSLSAKAVLTNCSTETPSLRAARRTVSNNEADSWNRSTAHRGPLLLSLTRSAARDLRGGGRPRASVGASRRCDRIRALCAEDPRRSSVGRTRVLPRAPAEHDGLPRQFRPCTWSTPSAAPPACR